MFAAQGVIGVYFLAPLLQAISAASLNTVSNAAGIAINLIGIGLITAGVVVFLIGRKENG
jgi:hypothetical protein